ncbi:MAG: phosphoribosylanthranilate isomerase [Actinobacteria bacterium]|nr:phosphoribosylanthranilate isomerase [Actinomycetota bacterium]
MKFCGFTNPEEAECAALLGVDAVGIVFYKQSKRYVTPVQARKIAERVKGKVMIVGVFVNENQYAILECVEKIGLDAIQLHGEEKPDDYFDLFDSRIKIIKAVKPELPGSFSLAEIWAAYSDFFLLDSFRKGLPGGTGKMLDLQLVGPYLEKFDNVILAGGISYENLKEFLYLNGVFGLDVSSGIEESPGKKSLEKMKLFIKEVRCLESK